jgi:hypothetical protein
MVRPRRVKISTRLPGQRHSSSKLRAKPVHGHARQLAFACVEKPELGLANRACPLAVLFRIDDIGDWAFNPFAWQRMFVLAFAVAKRFVPTQPLPGTFKPNLPVDRVIDFLAILCVAARLMRAAMQGARCG